MRMLITAVCCVAAVGCSRDRAITEADRDAIRTASRQYVQADDRRDADGMMQVVADGAIYMPSNAPAITGREGIRTFLKPHPWEKITATPTEIEGRDGLAFVRGSYTVVYQGKTYTGYYMEVWRKQPDDSWKVARKIWNSDQPS